jgi:small subunit ribosomal protein S9
MSEENNTPAEETTVEETPAAEAPAEETTAEGTTAEETTEVVEEAPVLNPVLALAADARYTATGKRKTAVARVTLKPGNGTITVNGRELNEYFPRPTLQMTAKESLEKVNSVDKVDVIAKVHGGGVAAQAGAVRHGIARALLEANADLRGELKRAGFLTRDARVKERKKAGLKKARKRPQFSKR